MEKIPGNGYLSINLGDKNMTEEKDEVTVFEGFVIPKTWITLDNM